MTTYCITPGDRAVEDFLAFPYGPVPLVVLNPLDAVLASQGQRVATSERAAKKIKRLSQVPIPDASSSAVNGTFFPGSLLHQLSQCTSSLPVEYTRLIFTLFCRMQPFSKMSSFILESQFQQVQTPQSTRNNLCSCTYRSGPQTKYLYPLQI